MAHGILSCINSDLLTLLPVEFFIAKVIVFRFNRHLRPGLSDVGI